MAENTENPIALMSTVTVATLGILVSLIDELCDSGAIDRARLQKKIDEFATGEPIETGTAAEKRMSDTVLSVVRKTLEKHRE